MKTLIAYVSQHGCTEFCAGKIRNGLSDDVDLINLKENSNADPASYDRVILGGSIHAGNVQGGLKKFCKKHENALLQKELGLFICCMETGKKAQAQFDKAFARPLRDHAAACGLLGGQFNFSRMNFFEKAIIKKVSGVDSDKDQLNGDAMEKFIASFQ